MLTVCSIDVSCCFKGNTAVMYALTNELDIPLTVEEYAKEITQLLQPIHFLDIELLPGTLC